MDILEWAPTLQCYKCKSVPGPGEKRFRYECIEQSHAICENCKDRCLCGSLVPKNPLTFVDLILGMLPWMCENYQFGCRENFEKEEDLKRHQKCCKLKEIKCPYQSCREKMGNEKLLIHIQTKHENLYQYLYKYQLGYSF